MDEHDLDGLPVLLIDCQASGASPKHGHLIDIAWAVTTASALAAGEELECSSTLVALPDGVTLPRKIERMTGISSQMLVGAPTFAEVALRLSEDLFDFVGEDGQVMLVPVAHYARYERPFVEQLLGEAGFTNPTPPFLCTHEIARRLMPGLPRRGLRALAGYFGEVLSEHKRAHVHVDATAIIWREIATMMAQEEGAETLGQVREWIARTKAKKGAPRTFPLPREERLGLPDVPGVYRMLGKSGAVLYVGKATSLKQRVNSYFRGKKGGGERKLEMATQVWSLDVTEVATPLEAALLEVAEIKRFEPPYNRQLRTAPERAIWFATASVPPEVSATRTADAVLGPFPRRDLLDALSGIFRGVDASPGELSWLYGLEEPDVFLAGVALWRAQEEVPELDGMTWDELVVLGLVYWERELVRRAERALARGAEVEEVEAEEEEADTPEEFVWTPEAVARTIEHVVMHVTRRARRALFLQELVDAAVCWRPPRSDPEVGALRRVVMAGGAVASAEELDGEEIVWEHTDDEVTREELEFDVALYDRVGVLAGELRRLARDADIVEVRLGSGEVLDRDGLRERMRWF